MAVTVEQGAKQFQGAFTELWLVTDTALNFGAAATGSGTFASVAGAVDLASTTGKFVVGRPSW